MTTGALPLPIGALPLPTQLATPKARANEQTMTRNFFITRHPVIVLNAGVSNSASKPPASAQKQHLTTIYPVQRVSRPAFVT